MRSCASGVALAEPVRAFLRAEGKVTVGHGVLRGAGAQRTSLLVALLCAWGITPLFAYLFAHRLGLGAPGGWLALALEMTGASTLVWWNISRSAWVSAARRAYRVGRVRRPLATA